MNDNDQFELVHRKQGGWWTSPLPTPTEIAAANKAWDSLKTGVPMPRPWLEAR